MAGGAKKDMFLLCLLPIGDVVVFFYKLVFSENTLFLIAPHAKRHFLVLVMK
jgi:hypothetical protein